MNIKMERAPTDRSTCKLCSKKIPVNQPRCKISYGHDRNNRPITITTCKPCGMKRMDIEINDIQYQKNVLEAMK